MLEYAKTIEKGSLIFVSGVIATMQLFAHHYLFTVQPKVLLFNERNVTQDFV